MVEVVQSPDMYADGLRFWPAAVCRSCRQIVANDSRHVVDHRVPIASILEIPFD
jgi:hypothetical protein